LSSSDAQERLRGGQRDRDKRCTVLRVLELSAQRVLRLDDGREDFVLLALRLFDDPLQIPQRRGVREVRHLRKEGGSDHLS
jgi:hypothetical protein